MLPVISDIHQIPERTIYIVKAEHGYYFTVNAGKKIPITRRVMQKLQGRKLIKKIAKARYSPTKEKIYMDKYGNWETWKFINHKQCLNI